MDEETKIYWDLMLSNKDLNAGLPDSRIWAFSFTCISAAFVL